MNDPRAELSSIASALEDLNKRITHLAEDLSGADVNDIAHELFEVERSLSSGLRRLNVMVR